MAGRGVHRRATGGVGMTTPGGGMTAEDAAKVMQALADCAVACARERQLGPPKDPTQAVKAWTVLERECDEARAVLAKYADRRAKGVE